MLNTHFVPIISDFVCKLIFKKNIVAPSGLLSHPEIQLLL